MDDPALLDAWRAGDHDAGNRLFNRYFTSVYRFFRNKVDRGVEDLVQRTFMACVEGRDRLRKDASFRAYVFGCAHNILRAHYRKQQKALEPDQNVDDCSILDMGASASTLLAARNEQRALLEALRRLPLKKQVLLELYYWEQLTGPELAEVLRVPENTARTRVRRARLQLKVELERIEKDGEPLETTSADLERWAASLRDWLADSD